MCSKSTKEWTYCVSPEFRGAGLNEFTLDDDAYQPRVEQIKVYVSPSSVATWR